MADTYDAQIFYRDGRAMVLYPDGDEAVLADVMRYMNPGAEFDEATGLQMATPPPPAESATYSRSTVQDKPFGSIAGSMAEPYMTQAYDALTRTPVVDPNSYVPQSVQRINQAVGNVGGAGLSGLLGLIYGGAGLAGDVANATGVGGGQRLANDLAGMVDVAGVGPEARMVEMLSNAGAGRTVARTVAERANQRGPVPTMGSNLGNLLGDVGEASTGIRAYHTTEKPFEAYDWSKLGVNTGYQTEGTSVGDWAANLAKIGPWAHEAPLSSKMGGYDLPIDISGKGKKFKSLDALERSVVKAGGPEQFRNKLVSEGFGHIRVADEEFKGTSFVGLSPESFIVNAPREGQPQQGLLSMGSK